MPLSSVGHTPKDRVRNVSPQRANQKIDDITEENITYYKTQSTSVIKARIKELDKEWDIERTLMINAAVVGLAGLFLGVGVNKKWLILPGLATVFLAQQAIQGWSPSLPVFRSMGIRSIKEIEQERYALIRALERKIADHN